MAKINFNRKGAMEMSVGTIVTIVLLMTVLILGLILTRTIFKSSIENINGIDQAVKGEINKLFAEDNSRKVVVYPPTRKVTLQKGADNLGFGFSIRNVGEQADTFSYSVDAVEASCGMSLDSANGLITLGRTRTDIQLPPGSFMDDPIFVRFAVGENVPPCQIRYTIKIENAAGLYGVPPDVDVEVKSA